MFFVFLLFFLGKATNNTFFFLATRFFNFLLQGKKNIAQRKKYSCGKKTAVLSPSRKHFLGIRKHFRE